MYHATGRSQQTISAKKFVGVKSGRVRCMCICTCLSCCTGIEQYDSIRHDSPLMRANCEPDILARRRLQVTACGSTGVNAAVSCALSLQAEDLESK